MTAPDEMTPEHAAKAHHAFCLASWDHLTDEQRRGTTFHGWEAHLPHPKDRYAPPNNSGRAGGAAGQDGRLHGEASVLPGKPEELS